MNGDFRKKLIVVIGLAVTLMAALLTLLIFVGADINRRVAKIESFRQELNFRTNALKSLATLKQDSERAEPYFNTLKTILPTKDELINFPKDLGNAAKINKVDLGFSFGSETSGKPAEPGYIAFNLTLSSTYSGTINFLKAMEKSRYFVGLESLDLTRANQSQKFSALASGKVFSQ